MAESGRFATSWSMNNPVAHSPRPPIPAQSYREHAENTRETATQHARSAARFYTGPWTDFVEVVEAAAALHDLGKIDEENQTVLRTVSQYPLPMPHADAGAAVLLRSGRQESAVLVAAHHAGLFSRSEEMAKDCGPLRDPRVANVVNERYETYLAAHVASGCSTWPAIRPANLHDDGFSRRIALSCLVDADHGDTARHYRNETQIPEVRTRWRERLHALDQYVAGLPKTSVRDEMRTRIYEECRDASLNPNLRTCDAAVGSGKTTAVMAHLLNVASNKELRHIFVVLPYVNIIKQCVDILRAALVLPGESPEHVVAEHHHQADFAAVPLRHLAMLWRAPIIVTTAVQFFETLGSAYPGALRKLHELPGSAVFLDEAHASIPADLWPQMWRWFDTWGREWGGHAVFASGSLPRFWELEEFVQPPRARTDVPDLVSESLRAVTEAAEGRRVVYRRRDQAMTRDELIEFVVARPGPRLLILNTVQSAAVVAQRMRARSLNVIHLSTALAPADRSRIVERIVERLQSASQPGRFDRDWTLVATSCVEAGMNFSFRTGFRETSSVASFIQVSGRVSRGAEYSDAEVWDFRVSDPELTTDPTREVARQVFLRLYESGDVDRLSPSDIVRGALHLELTEVMQIRARRLCAAEDNMEYPEVSQLCQVIRDTEHMTVVVDREIAQRLRNQEPVSSRDLQLHSVEIRGRRLRDLAPLLTPILSSTSLYAWEGTYEDDFLGYMAGALPVLRNGIGAHLIA